MLRDISQFDDLEELSADSNRPTGTAVKQRRGYSPRYDHRRRKSPLSNSGAHRRRNNRQWS